MRLLLRSAAVLTLASLALAANAQLYGLSSSSPGTLYTLNPATGAATSVASLGGANPSFTDLAFLGNTLYATDVLSSNQFSFGSIDTATGAFTAINNQGGSANWQSLAADQTGGVLYAVDLQGGKLVRVTPSGAITTVGSTNQGFVGLAFNDATRTLYGTTNANLYTINTATGASTLVGSLGLNDGTNDLAFDATGALFLNAASSGLYRVNVATGLATFVGSNGMVDGNGIDGIAFRPQANPTPEPSALAALGLGAAAFVRRRRK